MLPVLVIQIVFSLLPLGRHLLRLTTLNRYQSTGSSRQLPFTTSSRNVSIFRYRMSLVTYCSWILSRFTEFTEFIESRLGKTQLFQNKNDFRSNANCPAADSADYIVSKFEHVSVQ